MRTKPSANPSHQNRQTGLTIVELLIIVAVLVIIASLVFILSSTISKKNTLKSNDPQQTIEAPEVSPSNSRDKIRQDHAIKLASDLFYAHTLQKHTIELNQQGFDSFSHSKDKDPLLDPLTHKTYVFNENQTTMKPGEVIFRVNATCDNKISGSQGKGLIVSTSSNSEAIALKLESGSFACQASGI